MPRTTRLTAIIAPTAPKDIYKKASFQPAFSPSRFIRSIPDGYRDRGLFSDNPVSMSPRYSVKLLHADGRRSSKTNTGQFGDSH